MAVRKKNSARASTAVFKELGRRVKELRKKAGYTQATMATFGFSIRHWQQVEAGRPITLTTLVRISEIFKIKLEDLVRDLGPNEPQEPTGTGLEDSAPAGPTTL